MKLLSKLSVFALLFTFTLVAAQVPTTVYADNHEEQEDSEQTEEENTESDATYEYTAQPGDSYSLIARKAVQTYGLKEDVNLSQAQIIYAETNLTLAADSPAVETGEEITVSESAVANWVNRAQDLSEEQQSAWDVYAKTANFNTDNVGENKE